MSDFIRRLGEGIDWVGKQILHTDKPTKEETEEINRSLEGVKIQNTFDDMNTNLVELRANAAGIETEHTIEDITQEVGKNRELEGKANSFDDINAELAAMRAYAFSSETEDQESDVEKNKVPEQAQLPTEKPPEEPERPALRINIEAALERRPSVTVAADVDKIAMLTPPLTPEPTTPSSTTSATPSLTPSPTPSPRQSPLSSRSSSPEPSPPPSPISSSPPLPTSFRPIARTLSDAEVAKHKDSLKSKDSDSKAKSEAARILLEDFTSKIRENRSRKVENAFLDELENQHVDSRAIGVVAFLLRDLPADVTPERENGKLIFKLSAKEGILTSKEKGPQRTIKLSKGGNVKIDVQKGKVNVSGLAFKKGLLSFEVGLLDIDDEDKIRGRISINDIANSFSGDKFVVWK